MCHGLKFALVDVEVDVGILADTKMRKETERGIVVVVLPRVCGIILDPVHDVLPLVLGEVEVDKLGLLTQMLVLLPCSAGGTKR